MSLFYLNYNCSLIAFLKLTGSETYWKTFVAPPVVSSILPKPNSLPRNALI
jgi:hypothetical protein